MFIVGLLNLGGSRPKILGPQKDGKLSPCPEGKSNCVCSQHRESERHLGRFYVQPFSYEGDGADAMTRVIAVLMQQKGCSIVTNTQNYLHAEFKSEKLGFIDDVEFLLSPDELVIHVRSASRLGLSDFGVNRARLRELREAFDEADD